MDLYIIRHAIAQELGEKNQFTDEKRTLTTEGRSRMREAAAGLVRLSAEVELILTSPLVRAVETAEIVADALKMKKHDVKQSPHLAPGASPDALFAEIKNTATSSVALVGHQPDLGDIISRLVAGSGGIAVEMRKGGVCYVRITETIPKLRGTLVWLLTPKQLRLVGK